MALLLKPKFVSVDDFKNYWGFDLRDMLKNSDNPSNEAEIFLARIEDKLMNWIDANSFRRLKFECLRGKQLENFQKAILTQSMYVLRNGDLGMDSGYDAERGVIVDFKTLNQISVCQDAVVFLHNSGLFNLVVKNRPRFVHGYPDIDYFGNGAPDTNCCCETEQKNNK